MTTLLNDDQLDAALDRLIHGESKEDILASSRNEATELRPMLTVASLFEPIKSVEMPPAESLAADRNEFLAELTSLQLQPVSSSFFSRLIGRVSQHITWSYPTSTKQQKEMRNMSVLVLKAALVLTIAFGSLGGTLAAAAGSLPDSVVYPVKLAMEQARLTLADDPAQEASMHLAFAQERAQEMVRLAAKGEVPDEALLNRFQNHMREAYHLAAKVGDQEMIGLLLQAQEMTQAQTRNLEQAQQQVQQQSNEPVQEKIQDQKQDQKQEQTQEQLHQQIQTRLKEASQLMNRWRQEAENGLQDPLAFRLRFGQNRPDDAPLPPEVAPNDEPAQEQNQKGQDGESPGPGQPGGNPDCPLGCEPEGDKHQYGPGSEDQPGDPSNGPGQPGGNPDCDGDCEPVGDENKYGPGSEDSPSGPSNGPGQPGDNPDCQSDCESDPDRDQQRDQDKEQDRDGQDGSGNGEQGGDSSGSGEPGGNPDNGTPADAGRSGNGDSGGNPDNGSGSGDSGGSGGTSGGSNDSSGGSGGTSGSDGGSGSSGGSGGGGGK